MHQQIMFPTLNQRPSQLRKDSLLLLGLTPMLHCYGLWGCALCLPYCSTVCPCFDFEFAQEENEKMVKKRG